MLIKGGKLYIKEDVKILILYICNNVNINLTAQNISDILINESLADYFVIAETIQELISTDHLVVTDKNSPSLYITDLGRSTANELYKMIQLAVRERALLSALSVLALIDNKNSIIAKTTELSNGFEENLIINDGELDVFNLKLYVPSRLQAEAVGKLFKKNNMEIYKKIIELLIHS